MSACLSRLPLQIVIIFPLFSILTISCEFRSSISEEDLPADSIDSSGLSKEASIGKHKFEDGSVYHGDLIRGKPDGFGRREFSNGDIYEGQFENGLFSGHGTLRYKSNMNFERYFGNWKLGMRHGYGVLALADGTSWEGSWKDDSFLIGRFKRYDGLIMSGKWQGNFLSEGELISVSGDQFTGNFRPDGSFLEGMLRKENGEEYVGQFEQNIFHGFGCLKDVDGSLYTGSFSDGVKTGQGLLVEEDGTRYSGEFIDGLPHGLGEQSDPSGVSYRGFWEGGVRQGVGVIDFGDGTSFTGEFENGLAASGQYDWGDGRISNSYQDDLGNWIDYDSTE